MIGRLRQQFTYANVMATIAVFLALGGSAYAIKLGTNTVSSKQVKPNSLKGVDIKESALGQVPAAANAQTAANATAATNAQTAANASNAGLLDNLDSSAFGAGMMSGHINSLTTVTDTNDTGAASGISTATGSDLPVIMLTPNVPIVASDLAVRLSAAPGAGSQRTFVIFAGTGPTAVTCPISGTATTCNSGGATDVIPAGSVIELRESTNSTAPAPADAWFGWRARVAP